MAGPVVALLTDFGTKDHYAGTMKGVALGICPDLTFVDITHEIAPYDILGAALELAASYAYFPPGTVFLVVVDPGVGSARRAIAAEAGPYQFVAPDNGVLSRVFDDTPPEQVVEVSDGRYARGTVSRTFEGRDRFAPASAWLASGVAIEALGHRVNTWQRLDVPTPTIDGGRVIGQVLRVDRFGNLISNVDRRALEDLHAGGAVQIAIGTKTVDAVVTTYAEAPADSVCALFGSSGHLEVAVRGGSAAEYLGVARGATITVSRGEEGVTMPGVHRC